MDTIKFSDVFDIDFAQVSGSTRSRSSFSAAVRGNGRMGSAHVLKAEVDPSTGKVILTVQCTETGKHWAFSALNAQPGQAAKASFREAISTSGDEFAQQYCRNLENGDYWY